MHREAATREPDRRGDAARLLAEAGFLSEAHALVASLRSERSDDLQLLGLQITLDHRRGAISAALDGWRQLHASHPNGSGALAQLAQLRAEESAPPPRADLPLVRRALRQVAAGQHDRALAACSQGGQVAAAAGDREQRKLLALIEALLHELAGRPAAAAAVLTRLGEEPAFAHDVDRLAILARVSEQAGDRNGLQAAERVLGFLASSGIVSAYPRLLQIRRSLGDAAGAEAVERNWEEAFRRRIQRLTPHERLAAAVDRYVGLDRLRGLPLPTAAQVEDHRQRALLDLVAGADREVAAELSGGWRAEALLARGEVEAAGREAAAAMRQQPDLPHALLLARCGCGDRALLEQARACLLQAAGEGTAEPRILGAWAQVEAALGDTRSSAALREREAAALQLGWPPAGVVRAAAVYSMPGRQIGLVHDLIVRQVPAGPRERGRLLDHEIHGELGRGVRGQLRRIFAAVQETLGSRYPEQRDHFRRCAWSIHFTKEDEPSGGPSLGLPAAIAFASALLDRPVSRSLVFTGALSYDALALLSVRPVGEIERKLEAVLHVGAEALVFPAAQAREATAAQVIPPSFAREVARPVATFDEALALALWPQAGTNAG